MEQKNTSSSISSKSSSSDYDWFYDTRDCWKACSQRIDHSFAIDSIIQKLGNTACIQYDVLEHNKIIPWNAIFKQYLQCRHFKPYGSCKIELLPETSSYCDRKVLSLS